MSEHYAIRPGDIHTISYSKDLDIPILSISLRKRVDLQKFRDRILRDLSHVTVFNWEIAGEKVFSVVVLGDRKIQRIVRRLLRHFP